jgi:peptidoglycan DL-endopeptidase CwlO
VASHRRPKQPSKARVTFFGATAAATVAITTQGAQAEPEPTKEEVQEEVDRLYEEAEAATEEYNAAKEDEQELQADVEELQDSAARGQQELNELRGTLGSVASSQYRNGGLDPSVQLFLSSNPDAYLDQASALDQVSGRQAETLRMIESRQRTLDQQQQEATEALEELEQVRERLGEQKRSIQGRLNEAQELLNQLTEEEQAALEAAEAQEAAEAAQAVEGVDIVPGSSYGATALSAAQSVLGAPYVWGATGPSSFDCSGLTSWAYSQAGVSLPRVAADQAYAGAQISQSELLPGDLVLFYDDLHHIGMYAGNGQVIHAPRPGSAVEYIDIDYMPFMWGVRIG